MRCPECAGEVSALREFCPHCGAPTHLSRREGGPDAPAGRSEDELKRNRRNVLIAVAALLALAGITGRSAWFGTTFHIGSHHRERGPVVIDALQIYDAYRADAHAAARRFRDREMVVTGEFVRIVPDGQGNPDLRLKTSDPEAPLGVDLVPISYDQSARLKPGQRVTVSCQRITQTGDDRWLQNCAIQNVAGGPPPAPAASPAPTPPPPPAPPGGNRG